MTNRLWCVKTSEMQEPLNFKHECLVHFQYHSLEYLSSRGVTPIATVLRSATRVEINDFCQKLVLTIDLVPFIFAIFLCTTYIITRKALTALGKQFGYCSSSKISLVHWPFALVQWLLEWHPLVSSYTHLVWHSTDLVKVYAMPE